MSLFMIIHHYSTNIENKKCIVRFLILYFVFGVYNQIENHAYHIFRNRYCEKKY